jgi:uncharacterized 2Fe-2S/4Fe-4S cluster protein (DUF4445 family)
MTPSSEPGQTFALRFPQLGREIHVRPGETLLESARRGGVRIVGACGGRGVCGSCIVQLRSGRLEPALGRSACHGHGEAPGRRGLRACLVRPVGDCEIEIAPRSLAPIVRAEVGGADADIGAIDPAVVRRIVQIPAPSLQSPTADADRLLAVLPDGAGLSLDLPAAEALPAAARAEGGAMSVVLRGREIIACGAARARTLGLAIDLGTTNAAGFLIDLETGNRLATLGIENPQAAWGGDLVSRIYHATRDRDAAEELQRAAVTGVNALAQDLCGAVGASPDDIVDVAVCGNTAMQHLFAGLPVAQLGRVPFVGAVRDAAELRARDLGVAVNSGASVHLTACVGGYVGGDHVAALLACEARWLQAGPCIVMDIGTNTEISVIHEGRIHSASCPSGPALEGGHISSGMRAASGAIEHVRLGESGFELDVIDDEEPVGLCGSGVLDALTALYGAGVLDRRGRIGLGHPAVQGPDPQRSVVLAPGVALTQNDVRAVQLAKAAIRSGTELLLQRAGLESSEIRRFIIAGAFGAYIDIASAVEIGLLPDLPRSRFEQVGNAAGVGIRRLLVSERARAEARALARRCEYVELSTLPAFHKTFLGHIGFPARRSAE